MTAPKFNNMRGTKVPDDAAETLASMANVSAFARECVDYDLANHPDLPTRVVNKGVSLKQINFRLEPEQDARLEYYAEYGLRRAWLARALVRGVERYRAGLGDADAH